MKKRVKEVYTECAKRKTCNASRAPVVHGKILAEQFRYPLSVLAFIPEKHWELFAGCGNPLRYLDVRPGSKVLDLGCGAGIDSMLAMVLMNGNGIVIGLDFIREMVRIASKVATNANCGQASGLFVQGDTEVLPFRSHSFDFVLCNGVFSLLIDKLKALSEISRVLRVGGSFVMCDLMRVSSLPEHLLNDPDSWAWCMAGAPSRAELLSWSEKCGFKEIEIILNEALDYFARVTVIAHT